MPTIVIGDTALSVRLSILEKLAAMRGDVTVAHSAARAVHITNHPYTDLRGWRAPGTGVPSVLSYGQRRRIGGKDFAAVLGQRPALQIDLDPATAPFHRLTVSVTDASMWAARITNAAGLPR